MSQVGVPGQFAYLQLVAVLPQVWGLVAQKLHFPLQDGEQRSWTCVDGAQQIPWYYRCDGSSDCSNGSDERPEDCAALPVKEEFNDTAQLTVFLPTRAPRIDRQLYEFFYKTYRPRFVDDILKPGESTATVEVFFLDAPHSNGIPFYTHQGVGLLLRDSTGDELGRIAYQYWPVTTPTSKPLVDSKGKIQSHDHGKLLFG